MTIFKHEIKQQRLMIVIWGGITGLMIMLCMLTYPAMDSSTNNVFENMGALSSAFGMNKLSISSLMGVYGIESGNVLSIGGAFFAALIGIGMLSKEEGNHTAEFLFTHPFSRFRVVCEKLLATLFIILLFNILCLIFSVSSFLAIGEIEHVAWDTFWLFHLAQFIMQLEIAFICFAISSFMKRGSPGMGLGFAAVLYFINIICNLSNDVGFLKYITPYQYAEPSSIFSEAALDEKLILAGIVYTLIGTLIGTYHYSRKDLAS